MSVLVNVRLQDASVTRKLQKTELKQCAAQVLARA